MAFKGDVYTGFTFEKYNEKDFAYAQKHLRILSGLYGLLRPNLMRLTERNNAYETVNIVDPGQPEERQPPPLEQQRQVVVPPHDPQA